MWNRRVFLLKCLSDVCSSNSYTKPESIRIIPLSRNLSTATESSYFQTPTEHRDQNSSQNYQNHNVHYGESKKLNRQIPDEPLGGNGKGSYGGTYMEESLISNPYGQAYEGSGGVHHNSSGWENLKFNTNAPYANTSKGFQESYNGFYQNQNKVYENNLRSESHNSYDVGYGFYSEHFGNYRRGFRQNSRVLQHHWNENQHEAYRDDPSEVRRQNRDGSNSQYYLKPHGSLNGNYVPRSGQDRWNMSPSAGQYQQNQNNGGYERYSNVKSQVIQGEFIESFEAVSHQGRLEELDGFCKEGKVNQAVEILGLLEKQSIPVDLVRCLHLMEACGDAKSLQDAKAVHEYITRSVPPLEVSSYDRILETYSKCGSMDDATMLFKQMPERSTTSWNAMMKGFVKNGLGEEAIDLFTEFKKAVLKPDDQMFVTVFSACSVVGGPDEGILHFESMRKEFNMIPSLEHYASIVDMLGSAGHIDEALEFIEKMPLEPDTEIWEKLINLCRIHGNVDLGDRCADIINQHDPSRLTKQSKQGLVPVQAPDTVKDKEDKKIASESLLQARSRIHEYRAGNKSDPQSDKIYAQLGHLREQMKESGYVPQTRFVLHDVDQESKEEALLSHSERLAVSYGLFSSAARSPIRVIKNLRVCVDCHNALKIISKIVGRELIMRDAKRFHHFKDGVCSCKDYW